MRGTAWAGAVLCLGLVECSYIDPSVACLQADHCIEVADDGTIDEPFLEILSGESVVFVLGNRWQSVVEVDTDAPAACDDETHEVPYVSGDGLTGPMPRFAGGISVRGAPDGTFRFPIEVWESDAVSGVLLVIPWRDVAPSPGVYDFTVFTDALREATKYGKLVSVGIQAGARCPAWIYDPGQDAPGTAMVTKATGGDRCFDQTHPHFWDPNYVALLTDLQTELSNTLLAHAGMYRHVDKIKISGVNLMTSETRMPVDRENFCGFSDPVCTDPGGTLVECVNGTCPLGGSCECHVDPADGLEKCGRTTDDLPQVWADAGYRPSLLGSYFTSLVAEQQTLFPDKDINLMEIARAFPNVDASGVVQGFSNPDHTRRLVELGYLQAPEEFVVLNAALDGSAPPQDICLEAFDLGVKQIGFQTTNGLETWADLEPALVNARDVVTPGGASEAVSFLEVYLGSFMDTLDSGDETQLKGYDETFRARSELPNSGAETHLVENLDLGTYHYKIGGTHMTGGGCHTGTIVVNP